MPSKRKKKQKSKKKTKRPRHNYSSETKELVLSLVGTRNEKKEENKMSVDDYLSHSDSPSRRTLFRWLKQRNTPPTSALTPKKRGKKPLLSRAEQLVIGGWVLHRSETHRTTSANDIILWTLKHFGVSIKKSWVSKMTHSLKLSSHHVRGRERKYYNPKLPSELTTFIRNAHRIIKALNDPSRVVSIDTVRWTTPPFQIRSYGPSGGFVNLFFFCK